MTIETEDEYTACLDEAFQLLQILDLSDEQGSRLDELVDAIERYEDIHYACW
jgi:hypothetical protein